MLHVMLRVCNIFRRLLMMTKFIALATMDVVDTLSMEIDKANLHHINTHMVMLVLANNPMHHIVATGMMNMTFRIATIDSVQTYDTKSMVNIVRTLEYGWAIPTCPGCIAVMLCL